MHSTKFLTKAVVAMGLVVALGLMAMPANAGVTERVRLDVDETQESWGESVWHDQFNWTTPDLAGFEIWIDSWVFFDGSVYTYVYFAQVHTPADEAKVINALTIQGSWESTAQGAGLLHGTIGGGTADFFFSGFDSMSLSLFADPLNPNGDNQGAIAWYAQSYDPPGIVGGDSVDSTVPAPFGEVHGPVPEPSTIALLGIGLGGLILNRRRMSV